MIATEMKCKVLRAVMLMAVVAAIGAPTAAHAQDSGYYVDVCSSGTIDGNYYNDNVEQTVCLSGDKSGLGAYNEVDLEQYQENVIIEMVGADAQVYGPSGLVADSGEQQGSSAVVNAYIQSPQIGAWYYLNGMYDECQDWGASGYINCGWTGLMYGYSVYGMVTSPPTPSLSVSTSGTPSYPGQTVTFTATISNGPQGSIFFYDANSYIGMATINGTTATMTDSNLALGSHSITAVWQGSSDYQPTTSSPITQVVSQIIPSLTVGTSGTPSGYGQPVTFTATISSGPQGSLTFYDQGVAIGTGTIVGTNATFTTSSLSPGTHSITASWAGDSTYAPVSSGAITQTINPPPVIYSYSVTAPGGASGYAPNGNILNYTDSVNGTWTMPSTGGYDGLNRLAAATWTPVGGTQQSACWNYDSFGNRTAQVVQSTPCSAPAPTAAYNTNNQVTWVQNTAPVGFAYDAAGNVLADNLNNYLYDGEGKLCAVQNQFSGTVTGYLYDAQGTRVATGTLSSFSCGATITLTKIDVLGPSNEQVSELDGQGNWKHTNIYAGGTLIGTYDGATNNTLFALTDWLGTKRVEVGSGANPCATAYTSMPYGDGLTTASVPGYSQCPEDATEHHFTGKERDSESGNDYFGARYYASGMGTFMSPDPLLNSGRPDNPQSWNRYSYTLNNPLRFTDPTGLYVWGSCADTDDKCAADRQRFRDSLVTAQKALSGLDPDSKEAKALSTTLQKIGKEGEGDISINFGDAGHDKNGNDYLGTTIGNKVTLNYNALDAQEKAFNLNPSEIQALDAGLSTHEGTHAGTGPFALLRMKREHAAYFVESGTYQGLHNTDRLFQLWNESWLKVDQHTLEQNREKAIQNEIHPSK